MFMHVLLECAYVQHIPSWCWRNGIWHVEVCKLTCLCWEPMLCPLIDHQHQVGLIPELSLQPLLGWCFCIIWSLLKRNKFYHFIALQRKNLKSWCLQSHVFFGTSSRIFFSLPPPDSIFNFKLWCSFGSKFD